jgi:hypothetical protein
MRMLANVEISTSNGNAITSVTYTDCLKLKAIEDMKTFGREIGEGKQTSLSQQELNTCLYYLRQEYFRLQATSNV